VPSVPLPPLKTPGTARKPYYPAPDSEDRGVYDMTNSPKRTPYTIPTGAHPTKVAALARRRKAAPASARGGRA